MSRASLLARGQAAAEAGMVDTCSIRRVTGTVDDPDTGRGVDSYLSPDPYAGKCRVQQGIAQAEQDDVGEDYRLRLRLEVQVPMSVTGIEVNDQVTITAVGPGRDQDLVGRTFLVRDLFHKTDATARRIGVTERTD
jgi:hypothetical protein